MTPDKSESGLPKDGRRIDRSSIEFPYLDLDMSESIANGIYQRAGLGNCEIDELAAQLGQTVSGALRLKIAAAKMFGLIEKDGRSGYKLSSLGQEIVNDDTAPRARAAAFMNVPLYSQIFEKYKGHLLPPTKALEREMAALGVAAKQSDKARQVFERSARQAGFTAQGDDRLVQPRFDRVALSTNQTSPQIATQTTSERVVTAPAAEADKPLKYQLIDLLAPDVMTDAEQEAVWTLINYLARDKKSAAEKKMAPGKMPGAT